MVFEVNMKICKAVTAILHEIKIELRNMLYNVRVTIYK